MNKQQCAKLLSAMLVLGLLATVAVPATGTTPAVTISGTVLTTDGDFAPEGLTVKLYSFAREEVVASTTTRDGGFFMFSANPGYYKLTFESQRKGTEVFLSAETEPFGVFTQKVEKELEVVKKEINAYVYGNITLALGASFTTNATVKIVDFANNYCERVTSWGVILPDNTTDPKKQAYNVSFYAGKYNLIVEYPGYSPTFNKTILLAEGTGVEENVTLYKTFIKGILRDTDGNILTEVKKTTVTLIETSTMLTFTNEIENTPYFEIGAYPGNFILVVASEGYTTYINKSVTVTDGILNIKDVKVKEVKKSEILTSFDLTKINNLTAKTNAKLETYFTLPYLKMANTGLLRLQIDFAFGNGDFLLSQAELNAFKNYLAKAGPLYVPNQLGFEINSTAYTNVSGFTLDVKDAGITNASVPIDVNVDAPIYLNYSYTFHAYATVNTSDAYSCNFGFNYDNSIADYKYQFSLADGYVLTDHTFDRGFVDLVPVKNWQKFEVNPMEREGRVMDTATMKFEKFSDVRPVINVTAEEWGDYNILNSTYENYTVIVKANINVTFSAQNSVVPVGNITKYIWNFGVGKIEETENVTINHTYADAAENLKVTLTVIGSGGQTNSTNMTLHVDGVAPKPVINSNGNNTTYVFTNVTTPVVFNGSYSTDSITGNDKNGTIRSWAWNFGDNTTTTETLENRLYNISHTYIGGEVNYTNKTTINVSGTTITVTGCWIYDVTLNVTDIAGNWANATMKVVVNDTELPVPVIKVFDREGTETTSVIEKTNLTLNATESYDPHGGSIVKYNWTIEKKGEVFRTVETNNTTYLIGGGLEPGDWNITLTVWDIAGNSKNTTLVLNVRLNTTARPDLEIQNITLPDKFEAGTQCKIKVDIRNIGGENSSAVLKYLAFVLISGDGSTREVGNISSFTYPNGTALKYNETMSVEFTWTPDTAGSFTLNVSVYSDDEYYTYADNNVMKKEITISEAAWKTYAMYGGGIAAVVIALLVIYYISRRRKAAEEGEEEEKPKKKEEKKEEKKEKKK
ncbi:MAG: PKD domain-containing protein [Thermoplasmata archaeon]|nr:PKD domain-containing protein [Thermoplasmata archaeon]